MKPLIVCVSLAISAAANAGQTHTVELGSYLYRGTFTGIAESLQEKLANELVAACGESAIIVMNSLSISFGRGKLAGIGPLETQIARNNNKFLVDFPSHPKATISASFDCP